MYITDIHMHIYTYVYHTSSRVPSTYIYTCMYASTYAYINSDDYNT